MFVFCEPRREPSKPMPKSPSNKLWTGTFILVCTAQCFGSAQHALLQPTFPLYITSLGGTPFQVGLVLACFAVTSVVFRPLIGAWADSWSEPGVSMCGLILLSAAVLICFIPVAEATMFANALRGLGWAQQTAKNIFSRYLDLLSLAPAILTH
jgi:MFS family permease